MLSLRSARIVTVGVDVAITSRIALDVRLRGGDLIETIGAAAPAAPAAAREVPEARLGGADGAPRAHRAEYLRSADSVPPSEPGPA